MPLPRVRKSGLALLALAPEPLNGFQNHGEIGAHRSVNRSKLRILWLRAGRLGSKAATVCTVHWRAIETVDGSGPVAAPGLAWQGPAVA
jgi:hypothetical protein